MVIGADGRKKRHSFHRIMMRSAARLSYQQAQAAIDGRPTRSPAPILESVLRPLYEAYACVRRRVTSAGRSTSTCPSARSS
jgi:ribonuclease R